MCLRILIKIPTFVFMNTFKSSVQGYLWAFFSFILANTIFVLTFSRQQQMELINLHHSVFFDAAFQFITNTAEVILPIVFLIWIIQKKKELIKPYVFSYAISTLVVQLLKHLVFKEALRPILYFKHLNLKWHLIEGLAINELNSFPSGHTNAAWWMYFWMAYLSPNRLTGFLFGLLAFAVAYSRVYLFQHFPVDTLFGALFGCLASLIAYYFFVLKKNQHA